MKPRNQVPMLRVTDRAFTTLTSPSSTPTADLLPDIDWGSQQYHPDSWSVSHAGDRISIHQGNNVVSIKPTELVGLWVALCRGSGA
jgi:hypothetical protein